jgi:hypothetical protein
MPIDPRVVVSGDNPWIIAAQLQDHRRRLDALEAARTVIAADAITGGQIAANSITSSEIAANTITAADIAAGTITGNEIAANTITASDIAANTITAGQIASGTITATQIAANTIGAGQIAAGSITSTQIASGTIQAGNIQAGTITSSLIAANAITTNAIAAGAVDASKIAADTITAGNIAANAITASELAANSVTASAILSGTIDATKLTISTLSSITGNLGSITAGTITGGTLQTAASGSRVVMDSAGLRGYALDGVTKVFEINAGSGIASFTGVATLQTGSILPELGGNNMLINSGFEDQFGVSGSNSPILWQNSTGASGVGQSSSAARSGVYGLGWTASVTGTSRVRLTTGATNLVPVRANTDYTVSGWMRTATAPRSVRVQVQFYQSDGTTAAGASIIGATVAGSTSDFVRVVVTATAPSNAAYATPLFEVTNAVTGDAFHLDDVQFEQGTIPTAYSPKPDELLSNSITTRHLNITIGGYNLLNNTYFQNVVGITQGWSRGGFDGGLTTVATPLKYGPRTLQASTTNATTAGSSSQVHNFVGWADKGTTTAQNLAQIEAGKTYTFSYWLRGDPANTGSSLLASARIMTYDATATTNIDTFTAANQAYTTSGWTRISVTYTIPAASTAILARVLMYPENGLGGTLVPAGNKYYISGPQFEEGDEPTAFTPKADEILPSAVGTTEIQALAITAAKIAANTITASQIAANTITAGQIATGTITATQIASATITANEIATGTITGNLIAAGTITAQKLSLDWGGSNLLWDSSFEDVTTSPAPWLAGNATLTFPNSDIVPVNGQCVAKMVSAAAGSMSMFSNGTNASIGVDPNTGTGPYGPTNAWPGYYPILKGKNYTLSAYVSSPAVSRSAIARIIWYDSLRRQQLTAPTLSSTTLVAGGSLTASTTYYYRVTAVNANGETTGLTEFSRTTDATNKTIKIQVTMPADAQGTDYPVTFVRVYRSLVSGTFTSGYIQQAAVGGALVTVTDTGAALTAGSLPSTNTAYTVDPANLTTTGTAVPTEIPTTTPNPPVVTSPTVVTGPFVVTGAPGGTLWSRWVRPFVTAVAPTGAALAQPQIFVNTPAAAGEVHYIDAVQMERGDAMTGYARRSGEVLPGEVGATQITPNSITTNQILTAGVNADRIQSSSITTLQLRADAIDAMTITGATFQTSSTNPRVVLNASGLNAYNSSAVNTFNLDSAGALTINGGTITGSTYQTASSGQRIRFTSSGVGVSGSAIEFYATTGYTPQISLLDATTNANLGSLNFSYSASYVNAFLKAGGSVAGRHGLVQLSSSTSSGAVGPGITMDAGNLRIMANAAGSGGGILLDSSGYSDIFVSKQNSNNNFNGVGVTISGSLTLNSSVPLNMGVGSYMSFSGAGYPNGVIDEAYGVRDGSGQDTLHTSNFRTIIIGTNSGGTGTSTGWYYWTGGGSAWSSIKGKRNIVDLTERVRGQVKEVHGRTAKPEDNTILAKVRRLSAKHYDKSTKPPGHDFKFTKEQKAIRAKEKDWAPQVGFIAEEVEQEFPDLVETWEPTEVHPEGMKWMDATFGLPAILLEAIKELADKVDALEARLQGKPA